ncbi:MAG: hypothetical protein HY927_05165 [Elusimicrobia bacterium]|nr:hypothetical protein [Elusimicrobiota bacterium]
MMVPLLWALIAGPLLAYDLDDSPTAADLSVKVAELRNLVANTRSGDERVHEFARRLFERIPDAQVAVHVKLRGWDMERVTEKDAASIDRLMRSAGARFKTFAEEVPEPDLKDAYASATVLHGRDRIAYDSSLPGNQMGSYRYDPRTTAWGRVKVNEWIAQVATVIGDAFAFTTLIHESGHADQHQKGQLSPAAVVLGEIAAFHVEYSWLKLLDPHGERLAFLCTKALNAQKNEPSALHAMALAYVTHLFEVWETGGAFGKIEELVRKRGYEDGHAPGNGAKTPTRS